MASFYHSTYATVPATTVTSTWCSTWFFKLVSDGTVYETAAIQGLSGKSKCSWLISVDKGSVGPTFKLKSADYANFIIQWVEWITVAGLGTDATLPIADAASFHLGAYAITNGETYLNPLKSGVTDASWKNSGLAWAFNERTPATRPPGSVGDATYYTNMDGPFKETQTITVDSTIIMKQVERKDEEVEEFEKEDK
jgi:hypothetical protein